MPDLLTVKETAEYLHIPVPTVYYLVQRGQLPAVQIGGRWRVKKEALDREVLHTQTGSGQPSVLVVDDDSGVQGTFKLFLKKAGLSRVIVSNGEEALTALQKQKFDFCFLDLVLPDIQGDEIFRQAREIDPDLPVVIITGYPDSEILDRILKHGPVSVLKKPLKVEQLAQALKLMGYERAQAAA